jgi:hypothetical protein
VSFVGSALSQPDNQAHRHSSIHSDTMALGIQFGSVVTSFLNIRKTFCVLMLSLGIIVLSACSKNSEAEQLAEMRDSFTYKQYRRLSENGLALGLQAYLKGSEAIAVKDVPVISPQHLCVLRMALAYSETLKKQYSIALAETDIIESSQDCSAIDRAVATSIRAIVFQNLQWPALAQAESMRARAVNIDVSGDSFSERALMVHLAFAYLHINEKEWDKAKFHIDGIAVMIGQPWLSKVADFGLAVHEKRLKDALRLAQELSQDPNVPADVRQYFAQLYAELGGDVARIVSDPTYLAEMMSQVLWNAAKSQGSEQWKKISAYADRFDSTQVSERAHGMLTKATSGIKQLLEKPDKLPETGPDAEKPNK